MSYSQRRAERYRNSWRAPETVALFYSASWRGGITGLPEDTLREDELLTLAR
jgi:hypothetical protein